MESDVFYGFEKGRELRYYDSLYNLVIAYSFTKEIDEDKKLIIYVNKIDEYFEIRLGYQANKKEMPEFVAGFYGGIDDIMDEFRAKMHQLSGNEEYAEFIRLNPPIH